ncbi:MAG: FkbM family methyltransferase, partial [Pseudomonadales bacterium]
MSAMSIELTLDSYPDDPEKIAFCTDFLEGKSPRYLLGRNQWAQSISRHLNVAGFIDEYCHESEFLGKPVLSLDEVPDNGIVVSTVVGILPLTVALKLSERNIRHIDYFAFRRYSGLTLEPVLFWDEFITDYSRHQEKYEKVYCCLKDQQSRTIYENLINFRLSGDLSYMDGFEDRQHQQYFEDFLNLKNQGEVFLDVGCFDGLTSLEFIKRCPEYAGIHIFEPEPGNLKVVRKNLADYPRIVFHDCGLSDHSQTLRFSADGSSSRVSDQGELQIQVERLDDVIKGPGSFIKMDIEGAEIEALRGARHTILEHHPKLAICVYHRADDFWKIP